MVSYIIKESEKVIYEFVKFENVLISYDVFQDIEVEFSLDESVKGSSKDWIGIFHAGWNSYESFLVHECALGLPCDETGRRRKVKFLSKYVKHAKPGVPYQFVYINKYLEIMGVSQYFQFIINIQEGFSLLDNTICEDSFSPNLESSPFKISGPDTKNDNQKKYGTIINNELYTNCKLHSISNWKDSCTSCYQCKDIFQMKDKSSHDELLEKLKVYQDRSFAMQNRVHQLEKRLEQEKKKENEFKTCMYFFSEPVDRAKRSSFSGQEDYKGVFTHSSFDWDFSSKELYLKALIGQQELTIRDLNKVICELGYIDEPKMCYQPAVSLQDTVKTIIAEEKVVAEVCDINNYTSEEEF